MTFISGSFCISSLNVLHNAFKNIIFRIATIALDFVILRVFSLLAFWQSDYTSFLMFVEDITQKARFISSRGIFSRQSIFVGVFALVVAVGQFYDTMLWAIDNPGFIIKHTLVDGASLADKMAENPAYVVLISANSTKPSTQNTLNSAVRASLYTPDLNFTIPGIIQPGAVEVVPPLYPMNPLNGTARIWLDSEGFAVGLDPGILSTVNMSRNPDTICVEHNDPDSPLDTEIWNCNVPNSEGLDFLNLKQGTVPIWWDSWHLDFLSPFFDNPWSSLGSGSGSWLMKQVFTITKGTRRHTFQSTVLKASMAADAPGTLDDGEISDFMRKTWSTNGTMTAGIQDLVDVILRAKGNNTGRTFGQFFQTNTSLLSMNTDYLNVANLDGSIATTVLRFVHVNTTLIRSETLSEAPAPSQPCPGIVNRDFATGGEVVFNSCHQPTINQSVPLNGNHFLGRIDASAVGIFNGFLGDGSSNISSEALTQTGLDWINQQGDLMDRLLLSRAMLLGGNSSAVTVDVGHSVAAISGLQLLLTLLPCVLVILIWPVTRAKALSYYQNSFLAAVLVTTHTTTLPCDELGVIPSMPEITVQRKGGHVTLGTPFGGTITNTVAIALQEHGTAYEPLVANKETP